MHCVQYKFNQMQLYILFILLVSSQAHNLRDATLFRAPLQEAKTVRNVDTPDECEICQNLVAVMQNSVTEDNTLYVYDKNKLFQSLAFKACNGYHTAESKLECSSMVEHDQIMDHLYDTRPSACEVFGHCKRCRPCPPPALCIICESPDASEVGIADMIHSSWSSFVDWFNTPATMTPLTPPAETQSTLETVYI